MSNEVNPKSDPRFVNVPVPCQYCKHLIDMGSQFSDEGWVCKAFPKGIPYQILTLRELHTEAADWQAEQVAFDPVILEDPDGKKWHYNADGSWAYVKKETSSPD